MGFECRPFGDGAGKTRLAEGANVLSAFAREQDRPAELSAKAGKGDDCGVQTHWWLRVVEATRGEP
jgi:hypothetical protein